MAETDCSEYFSTDSKFLNVGDKRCSTLEVISCLKCRFWSLCACIAWKVVVELVQLFNIDTYVVLANLVLEILIITIFYMETLTHKTMT